MSNVKVVKVDSLKLSGSGTKKSKKNPPKNVDYLQNIVRDTKKTPYLDLTQSELINKLFDSLPPLVKIILCVEGRFKVVKIFSRARSIFFRASSPME